MKKAQIQAIIIIVLLSLFNCCYFIYLGYTNGSEQIVFDTVKGTVEEYRVHNGAAFVKLEGKEILYRASSNGEYDKLGLQNRVLHVGEFVEILYEAKIRGDRYSIVGISTETWSSSIMDEYLKGWDRFKLICILFGVALGLAGIIASTVLVYKVKKKNQLSDDASLSSDESQVIDSRFMTPTSVIRMPSTKGRIIFCREFNDLEIVVKRAFGVTELIVDGMVYAEKRGIIETSYTLEAFVGNVSIKITMDSSATMYLYVDENLLEKKKRMV